MDGILVINKPEGITSHDVVDSIRKKFRIRRVGHAGTLDPIATGILIILLGRSTKLFNQFVNYDKEYEATLTLGVVTDTGDIQGRIIGKSPCDDIAREKIEDAFRKFLGQIKQVPPMVSALKYKGKRLYELAKRGIEVPRRPRDVKIYSLKITNLNLPYIDFYIKCSKGTYIRKLGEDIGRLLGCGGYISKIKRTAIGPFRLDDAINLDIVNEAHIRHWQS